MGRQLDLIRWLEQDAAFREVMALRDRGALFVLNNSGGKDSQAMMIMVRALVPAEQIVVIHAHLPGVAWAGTEEHAREISQGLEFHVTQAGKTFFEMVRHRGMFPSPNHRQCTSDLKRGPIDKLIRRLSKEKGRPLIVSCLGLRADESSQREAKTILEFNKRGSVAGRTWLTWLPIHHMSTAEVFASIAAAGQRPHWVYAAGMSRLSCVHCPFQTAHDVRLAARLAPAIHAEYVALEREIDHTILMPTKKHGRRFLADLAAAA